MSVVNPDQHLIDHGRLTYFEQNPHVLGHESTRLTLRMLVQPGRHPQVRQRAEKLIADSPKETA